MSIAGFVALLWAIIEAPTKGWSNTTVLVGLGAGLGGLAAFVLWELRCDHPMLDVRFFRNRRFSAANASITMVYFAMLGSMFVITQYLQNVLGYAPLEAGVRMLPMAVVMLLLAPTAPRLVERIGTKVVVGGGLLVVVAGLTIASTISTSSARR